VELKLASGDRIVVDPARDIYLGGTSWERDGHYAMPGWKFTFSWGAEIYAHPVGGSNYVLYVLRWEQGKPDRIEPFTS